MYLLFAKRAVWPTLNQVYSLRRTRLHLEEVAYHIPIEMDLVPTYTGTRNAGDKNPVPSYRGSLFTAFDNLFGDRFFDLRLDLNSSPPTSATDNDVSGGSLEDFLVDRTKKVSLILKKTV